MEKIVTVKNGHGLHARPAALFVKEATGFESEIKISFNGKEVNAKSILNVLSLGVDQGAEVRLNAEGADSFAALEHLETLLSTPDALSGNVS